MHDSINKKNLLRKITNYIRQQLDLQVILTATVAELRSLLGIDRVKVYKFNSDGSGQIIAESVDSNRLPSMLGLHFPEDDIPAETRELYLKSQVRSIVNVDTKQIGYSPLYDWKTGHIVQDNIHYRPVDPCHLEYLTAIGVKSSVVLPILHSDRLWGLLASHHSEPRSISSEDLELVQMVAEQISVAIAQSTLLSQVPVKSIHETTIKQIMTLLHSLSSIEFQSALAQAVGAFGGCGGRLCIKKQGFTSYSGNIDSFRECLQSSSRYIQVYTTGTQPVMPEVAKYQLMEQYSVWQEHYESGEDDVWAISDIYQTHKLRFLQVAFQASKVRSMLMIPLFHRRELLGYLSIFRNSIEKETLWSGEFDSDSRLLYPRHSFYAWRESNKTSACEWNVQEIELATEISKQFAFAVQEYQLQQQVDKHANNLQYPMQNQQTSSKILTGTSELTQLPDHDHDIDKSIEQTLSLLDELLEED